MANSPNRSQRPSGVLPANCERRRTTSGTYKYVIYDSTGLAWRASKNGPRDWQAWNDRNNEMEFGKSIEEIAKLVGAH